MYYIVFRNKYFSLMTTFQMSKYVALNDTYFGVLTVN